MLQCDWLPIAHVPHSAKISWDPSESWWEGANTARDSRHFTLIVIIVDCYTWLSSLFTHLISYIWKAWDRGTHTWVSERVPLPADSLFLNKHTHTPLGKRLISPTQVCAPPGAAFGHGCSVCTVTMASSSLDNAGLFPPQNAYYPSSLCLEYASAPSCCSGLSYAKLLPHFPSADGLSSTCMLCCA